MKKLLFILTMLAMSMSISATKIYQGNSTYVGNILFTVDGLIPSVIISLLI